MIVILLLLAFVPAMAYADMHTTETRCCVEIKRDADGSISRSGIVKRAFRKRWPCPAGASLYEACPGWQIDHVIPLACGGKDEVSNMQWLPVEIKTCADDVCKDRFERRVYC